MKVAIDNFDGDLGGKKISKVILGTSQLHNSKNCELILNTAIEYGITTFDLAPTYFGNDKIKAWIASLHKENPEILNELVFIQKGGCPEEVKQGYYKSKLQGTASQIASNLKHDLIDSLKFLGLKKADIFLLHRDDEDYCSQKIVAREKVPVKSIHEGIEQEDVKCLYTRYGVSNWEDQRVKEMQQLTKNKYKLPNSCSFSLWEAESEIWTGERQQLHADLINESYLPGCLNLAYAPLGGNVGARICTLGFEEAKKYTLSLQTKEQGWRQDIYEAIFTEKNKKRYEQLKEFTERINNERFENFSLATVVAAYALAHPRIDACIISAVTVDELDSIVRSYLLSKTLTLSDLSYLHDI